MTVPFPEVRSGGNTEGTAQPPAPGPACTRLPFSAESGKVSVQGWAQTLRAVHTCWDSMPSRVGGQVKDSPPCHQPCAPSPADHLSPRDLAWPFPRAQWAEPDPRHSGCRQPGQEGPPKAPGRYHTWRHLCMTPHYPPPTRWRTRTPPHLSLVPPAWGLILGQAWARLPGRTNNRCYKLGVCCGHGWGRVGPGPRGPRGGPDPDSPG